MIAYTAIAGGKDETREDITSLAGFCKFKADVYNAKIYKILPHMFLDTDISIWMDGNIRLLIPPEEAVDRWLKDNDIALFRHYKSKNLDWELKWIKYKFGRHSDVAKEAEAQVEHYAPLNITNNEMGMGGFIIRRHTPLVARFNEAWFCEVCVFGERDQLSLPVVLRKFPELKVNRINLDIKNNPFTSYGDHTS